MTQYLVPNFILKNYHQGVDRGRFNTVTLFVDVSGFSQVTNTMMQYGNEAAETMADVMNAIFEPLVTAVYSYGGFITTFAGDAFTALFPIDDIGNPYHHALAAAMQTETRGPKRQ